MEEQAQEVIPAVQQVPPENTNSEWKSDQIDKLAGALAKAGAKAAVSKKKKPSTKMKRRRSSASPAAPKTKASKGRPARKAGERRTGGPDMKSRGDVGRSDSGRNRRGY